MKTIKVNKISWKINNQKDLKVRNFKYEILKLVLEYEKLGG